MSVLKMEVEKEEHKGRDARVRIPPSIITIFKTIFSDYHKDILLLSPIGSAGKGIPSS